MLRDDRLQPHRRFNPLTGEWILVSPHRAQRPWQGHREASPPKSRPVHDPDCNLCPGNQRANGNQNPAYTGPFIFDNDFSAFLLHGSRFKIKRHPLFKSQNIQGICRVICFSPRHDLSLPEMEQEEILAVIQAWIGQMHELGRRYAWVQIFENKGEMMGCSNPHPHGQIWASDQLPEIPGREHRQQKAYFRKNQRPLLEDYARQEQERAERIVVENKGWVAVVPFWAVWPYETLLLPRRHISQLPDLNEEEQNQLADILKRLLTRYDNLFEVSFPYTMGWHGAPFAGQENHHWQLHAHIYPPLLRSATIKKFMVGYEMTAEAQRDLTAEEAAERLRAQSERHYKRHD
jgi:UDPglucose--hexose-1-phosphate uridylyltransferase